MFFVVLQGKNEDIQLKSTVKTEMKGTDLELKGKIYFLLLFLRKYIWDDMAGEGQRLKEAGGSQNRAEWGWRECTWMANCQGGRLAEKQADKEQGKPQLRQRERDMGHRTQTKKNKNKRNLSDTQRVDFLQW